MLAASPATITRASAQKLCGMRLVMSISTAPQPDAHQLALHLQKRVALIHRLIVGGAEQRQKAAHHQQ